MDSYQPIFDAVRSRISNGDIGSAVESAIQNSGISNAFYIAGNRAIEAAAQYDTPFVLLKPQIYQDGDHWCALYGANIHAGVCGFGKSPSDAQAAFDKAWYEKLPARKALAHQAEVKPLAETKDGE